MRKFIITTLSCAALAAAAPALAQGRGGGAGGPPPGAGAGGGMGMPGMGMPGGVGRGMGMPGGGGPGMGMPSGRGGISETGAMMRDRGRLNSRARQNAADIAIQRANRNSVLRGSTVVAGPLVGLGEGAQVLDSNGIPIGTVARIVPSRDGVVRNVLVRAIDGRVYPLAPGSVMFDAGRLIATTLMASANR